MEQDQTYSIDWDSRPEDTGAFEILHTAVLLVLARLALIVLGFQRTATIVNRFSSAGDPCINVDPVQVQATKYAVSLAAAFIPARILCLERSLVLYYKLKRNRVPAALRLGVRALPFAAHAWVELEGSPVNETADFLKDFKPILELV
jgi:hypothetical protein